MTVRVELPDGTAWEHEDANQINVSPSGELYLRDRNDVGVIAVYAPGAWAYAERVS